MRVDKVNFKGLARYVRPILFSFSPGDIEYLG